MLLTSEFNSRTTLVHQNTAHFALPRNACSAVRTSTAREMASNPKMPQAPNMDVKLPQDYIDVAHASTFTTHAALFQAQTGQLPGPTARKQAALNRSKIYIYI